jgi:hypothetical protein
MSEWVQLQVFASRAEAELVRGMLEAHGVPATVSADDQGGMRPDLAFILGARVLVEATRLYRARQILIEIQEAESDSSSDSGGKT